MERKRIVCFGDSNTWGYDPGTAERFPEDVRWTGLLAQALGENYWVIEEGQNGRTIATDDPCEGEKNGMRSLVPCIESQKPFDLLIIMLGTNDLKRKFQYCAMDVAGEMELMAEKITNYLRFHMKGNPQVLLISPVHIGENITRSRDEFKTCNVYAKEKCRDCFARFYCSGGCAANSWNFHHSINDAYDIGCELERKRVECAIMIKAALAEDEA